jgi:LysR substrate binding domain
MAATPGGFFGYTVCSRKRQSPVGLGRSELNSRAEPLGKVHGSEVLFREPLLAALPREHALANERAIRVAQLVADRFVLYAREGAPEMFDAIVAICKESEVFSTYFSQPEPVANGPNYG